jgi:hypothetical protein
LADIAAAVHATGAGTGPTSPPSFCGSSPPMSRIGITRRGSRWRGGRAAAHGAAEDQLGAARGAAEDRLDVGSGYPGRYLTRGWHEAALRVLLRRWAHGNATKTGCGICA